MSGREIAVQRSSTSVFITQWQQDTFSLISLSFFFFEEFFLKKQKRNINKGSAFFVFF